MNIKTLIDAFSETIAQDSELTAWCQSTYGNGHTVYVNVDERNLPGKEGCPFVALWPETKSVGLERSTKNHHISVICCIYDKTKRTNAGIDNIIEFMGVGNVEDLRKKVETAIAGIDLGNSCLAGIDIAFDTITFFPFFYAGMSIEIPETVTLGSDYLA